MNLAPLSAIRGESFVINAPELFLDATFQAWLNDPGTVKFTWHRPGAPPTDHSDVMVLVDPGLVDGTNTEMPGWTNIVQAIRKHIRPHTARTHIPVRITNLPVD